MNSRRGTIGSGLMYFVFFLMMALILAGIYGGLIAFFGKGYDYRRAEANLLLQETRDCFVREGFFDLTIELDENVFIEKCRFSSKALEDGEHLIYMKNKKGVEFSIGVTDFKVRCFLNARVKNKDFPLCETYGEDASNKDYLIVGSSQNSRRVAA